MNDRPAEVTALLMSLVMLGVELEELVELADAVVRDGVEPSGSATTTDVLTAVARHPRAPLAVLDALVRCRLVDAAIVREHPALVLLALEPLERLTAFPHLVPLLALPRRSMLRVKTVTLLRSACQSPYLEDEVRAWIEHLEGLDDPDAVIDAVVGAKVPGASPARAWLALATSSGSIARTTFIPWVLDPRQADLSGWPPHFGSPFGVQVVTALATAARSVLGLLPDAASVERFGDGFAELLAAHSLAWPPLFREHQWREIVASLVRTVCSEGGLETVGPEMMSVFATPLATPRRGRPDVSAR
ncbi:hypothetical protein BH23DEI1_BH23DEI1_03400 [soil metagenome]